MTEQHTTHQLVVSARILQSESKEKVSLSNRSLVLVDRGAISSVVSADDPEFNEERRKAIESGVFTELPDTMLLLPGFVDTHVHAPQFPQMGTKLDVPLEEWLNQWTFPLEARYQDQAFATTVFRRLIECLLSNGVTSALYFATIHLEASLALAEQCLSAGQRGFVGVVTMDNPSETPDYYRDPSAEAAVAKTEQFIELIDALSHDADSLVQPVITPRFLPTSTTKLLEGLGRVAQNRKECHIQTHCSESDWAHSHTRDRFGKSDTMVLDEFGLLNERTMLAHSVFASDDDIALLSKHQTGIAHCPLSNAYFADAVLPTRRILSAGVPIGLGTDIAGGPSPSLMENARMAIHVSRMLESGVDCQLPGQNRGVPDSRITHSEALWMATQGGGSVLHPKIGQLKPGFRFDAVSLQLNHPDSDLTFHSDLDDADEITQRIIYGSTASNVRQVWVDGQLVHDKDGENGWFFKE